VAHDESPEQGDTVRRATQMFLVGVIGVSFVGLVVGLRQGVPSYAPPDFEQLRGDVEDGASVPAMTYREFDRREYGPNRDWRNTLADLAQPAIDLSAPVQVGDEERAQWLRARASRRAFDGAPPTVPHPVDADSSTSCVACHGEGLNLRGIHAPKVSHAFMPNCLQCHVEQRAADLEAVAGVASSFEGLASFGRGSRAWQGAPPTIPHATFMREDCASCHGPQGASPIRTSHPWQVSCTQCHAPSATLDQAVFDAGAPFLPALSILEQPRAARRP